MKDIPSDKIEVPPQKDPSQTSFLEKLQQHPFVAVGAGVALIVHLASLLSLPPALRGKGAPFLPTSKSHGNAMFEQLHQQLRQQGAATTTTTTAKRTLSSSNVATRTATIAPTTTALQMKLQQEKRLLRFVDLGSGDGRLVFRAARTGMFEKSIGYEINPGMYGTRHILWSTQCFTYFVFGMQKEFGCHIFKLFGSSLSRY